MARRVHQRISLLREQSAQSQVVKICPSCLLVFLIRTQDSFHLAHSQNQPYNKIRYTFIRLRSWQEQVNLIAFCCRAAIPSAYMVFPDKSTHIVHQINTRSRQLCRLHSFSDVGSLLSYLGNIMSYQELIRD